nr:hypothetical protein CFP56_19394 [Quercus suber]
MAESTPQETLLSMDEGRSVQEAPDEQLTSDGHHDASISATPSIPATLRSFTDKALHFLAHASNETLGACFLGLGATTYLVLGRVGLVIIGVAGGVVLHATWDGARGTPLDEETNRLELKRRRETAIDVAKRLLNTRRLNGSEDEIPDTKVFANQSELDFSSFGPEAAAAFETFTDAVIKDYVYYWYGPTLPGEESFPTSCKRTFTAFLLSMCGHLRQKRPADTFLDFVTNASSIVIVFLNELAAALNGSPNTTPETAIATYLKLKPDSSLVYLLDEKSQTRKLNEISEDILQAYLDPKSYNCPPVHIFLKQIFTQLVLGYTITLCSEPAWINDWIVYGLEESETTKEVMNMVDAGVEGRPIDQSATSQESTARETAVQSRKEALAASASPQQPNREHKRQMSRAEGAMDDAMKEARRLTQLMIEEDEKRAKEDQGRQAAGTSSEDVSDGPADATPTSSQSDMDRHDDESSTWSKRSSFVPDSPLSSEPSKPAGSSAQFTSFDQLLPSQRPTALAPRPTESPQRQGPPLTLHNATISIFDDSVPGERTSIKAKPTTDYLVQIEPTNSAFAGWMIARKYADFEMLHEVLRRISVITGVPQFTNAHSELPKWKVHTKASLREELERYLTDAVRFQSLAESEGMKRFLEKDLGLSKSPGERKGFGWPTPDAFGKFGGDMMNVLTKAPKQVAGGGKAVLGGVAGLVGAPGKKPNSSQSSLDRTAAPEDNAPQRPTSTFQSFVPDSYLGSVTSISARQSHESVHLSPQSPLEQKSGLARLASADALSRPSVSSQRPSVDLTRSIESVDKSIPPSSQQVVSPAEASHPPMNLPPPPSEISDDFGSPTQIGRKSLDVLRSPHTNLAMSSSAELPGIERSPPKPSRPTYAPTKSEAKPKIPLTERETTVAIELMFAVITELYTLQSPAAHDPRHAAAIAPRREPVGHRHRRPDHQAAGERAADAGGDGAVEAGVSREDGRAEGAATRQGAPAARHPRHAAGADQRHGRDRQRRGPGQGLRLPADARRQPRLDLRPAVAGHEGDYALEYAERGHAGILPGPFSKGLTLRCCFRRPATLEQWIPSAPNQDSRTPTFHQGKGIKIGPRCAQSSPAGTNPFSPTPDTRRPRARQCASGPPLTTPLHAAPLRHLQPPPRRPQQSRQDPRARTSRPSPTHHEPGLPSPHDLPRRVQHYAQRLSPLPSDAPQETGLVPPFLRDLGALPEGDAIRPSPDPASDDGVLLSQQARTRRGVGRSLRFGLWMLRASLDVPLFRITGVDGRGFGGMEGRPRNVEAAGEGRGKGMTCGAIEILGLKIRDD